MNDSSSKVWGITPTKTIVTVGFVTTILVALYLLKIPALDKTRALVYSFVPAKAATTPVV